MSEATYAAMREFIKLAVEIEVKKAATELRASTETRAVEPDLADFERRLWERIEPKLPVLPELATREGMEAAIEKRFGDLQARTFADVYQGVYDSSRSYTRGVLVTWDGSLWLSQAETKVKPGVSADWKLVVKSGRDRK